MNSASDPDNSVNSVSEAKNFVSVATPRVTPIKVLLDDTSLDEKYMELVLSNGYIISISRLRNEACYIYKFEIQGFSQTCKFVLTGLAQLQEALTTKCQDQFLSMVAASLANTISVYIQNWDNYLEQKKLKLQIPLLKKRVKAPKYRIREAKDVLYIVPEDNAWVAIVKRVPRKGFQLYVWSINENGEPVEEILQPTIVGSPQDIEQLDLDDNIKAAIIDALAKWDSDKQRRKQEATAALREVSVVPKTVTDKDVLIEQLARALINRFGAAGIFYITPQGKFFAGIKCYENGVYKLCKDWLEASYRDILTEIQAVKVTKKVVEEAINRIPSINRIEISQEKLRPIIAFENGLFDWKKFLETGSIESALRPFDRSIYVENKIPHKLNIEIIKRARQGLEKYIPPRSCEELVALLKALSPKAYELLESWAFYPGIEEELLKSRICYLLQFIGRMLFPGYRAFRSIAFKDFFVFLGPPNAGKSTFVFDFVGDTILGHENYRVMSLQSLAGDAEDVRREFYQLYNVLMAVIKMDVERDVKNIHAMRTFVRALNNIITVSGGDPVEARKLREDIFMYYPAFKFVMVSNEPPPIALEGEGKRAFLVRAKIMEFKNWFNPQSSFSLNTLNEEDIETIIILAIYGLRLIRMQGYADTGIKDPEDAWLRYSEPRYALLIYALEKGYISLDPRSFADRDALYNTLREAAKEYLLQQDPFLEEDELNVKVNALVLELQNGSFVKTFRPLLAKLGVEYDRNSTRFKGIKINRRKEKELSSYAGNSSKAA